MMLRRFLMLDVALSMLMLDVASWCSTSLCYFLYFFFFITRFALNLLCNLTVFIPLLYIFFFIYICVSSLPLTTHFTSWNHLSIKRFFFYYFWWFSATKRISEFSSSLPFTWSKVLMLNHLLKGSSYFLLLLGSFPGFHGVLLDYCPGLFTIDDNSSTLSEPDTAHTWSLDRSRASETLLHSWR